MEPLEILSLVSRDVNILVICGDEGSREETSKRISTIPGRDRTRCLQETSADPSKCNHDGWKRVGRVSRDNPKARESILEEDLAKNVSMSLHNSFCLNRESKVKSLPNQVKRLQEQREWMRSYEQLKAWAEIVISSDDEEAHWNRSQCQKYLCRVPRGRRTRGEPVAQKENSRVLSLEREGARA